MTLRHYLVVDVRDGESWATYTENRDTAKHKAFIKWRPLAKWDDLRVVRLRGEMRIADDL